jgi:hypothetical protein
MAGRVGADVEPGDDIGNLGFGERQFGHTFIGAAVADDGGDEDAFLVVKNEDGADEIGRARAAFASDAMTAGAESGEDFSAALEGGGILA